MAKIKAEPEHSVGYECPMCKNEEIELGQSYCQICGEPLEWVEDEYDGGYYILYETEL